MSAVVSLLSSDPDVVVSVVVLSLLSAELLSPAAAQDVCVLLLPVVVVVVSELWLSSSDVPPSMLTNQLHRHPGWSRPMEWASMSRNPPPK